MPISFFSRIISQQFILHLLSYGVFIFSVICYFSALNEAQLEIVFNSDAVGIPSLFKDIYRDGGKVSDWYLASAPSVFPDLSLYYLLFQFFGTDFLTITFIYAFIQSIAIVLLSVFIFRRSFPEPMRSYSWLVPVFYSITFFEAFYYAHDIYCPYFMTIYCFHGGAYVNALIAISILLSHMRERSKLIALFLFSTLAAFSDILFIVLFIAPLIATKILLFNKQEKFKQFYIPLVISVGTVIGVWLYSKVNNSGLFHFASSLHVFNYQNIKSSFDIFYDQMKQYFVLFGFKGFQMAFTFVSIVTCIILVPIFRKRMTSPVKFFFVFYIMFSLIVFSAPIINGNYLGWDTIRYSVAPFFFSMIVLAFFIGWIIERFRYRPAQLMLSYSIIIAFFFIGYAGFSSKGLGNYFTFYPSKVKALDSVCVKYGMKRGVSVYGYAKFVSVFSKQNVQVLAVYNNTAGFSELGSNGTWFHKGKFDFVLPFWIDPEAIKKNYTVLDSIHTPDLDILRVKTFVFPENSYFPKTLAE